MTDRRPERLFHYTCEHAAIKIRGDDSIRPAGLLLEKLTYAMLPESERDIAKQISNLAWFTDLEPPANRDALGLTMLSLNCDRTAFCFEVIPDWTVISWWPRVRRKYQIVWAVETAGGSMPAHWFVSEQPVKVLTEIPL